MGMKNMSLNIDATITVTGGTPLEVVDNGVSIANGVQLVVPSDTDYRTRRSFTAKYKPPTINPATGQYGKDKKSISYVIPLVLSDGRVVFNTLRIEREVHPFVSNQDCAEMNKVGAQLLFDADTEGFWVSGSLS